MQVTRYAENLGLLEAEGGILEVRCTIEDELFICQDELTMSVVFEGKGMGEENGMVKEEETILTPWVNPCDEEEGEEISGLLEPTEGIYITG